MTKKLNNKILLTIGTTATTTIMLLLLSNAFFILNANAQEQEINQNSLVACVDYHLKMIEERGDKTIFKETSSKTLVTIICDLGYEHTGKYTHLLPESDLEKYLEMAAIKAYLEKIPLN